MIWVKFKSSPYRYFFTKGNISALIILYFILHVLIYFLLLDPTKFWLWQILLPMSPNTIMLYYYWFLLSQHWLILWFYWFCFFILFSILLILKSNCNHKTTMDVSKMTVYHYLSSESKMKWSAQAYLYIAVHKCSYV